MIKMVWRTSSEGVEYESHTPGASPDNPIVSPTPPQAPTNLNPTGEPLPGANSGGRATLLRDEWKSEQKEKKRAERIEKEVEERHQKEYAAKEKKEKARDKQWRRSAGLEVPKQGLHRFGYAEEGMTSSKGVFGIQMEPGGGSYSDAFSSGGFDLFSGGTGRGKKSAGAQMSVNFSNMNTGLGGLNIGFGGLGNAMRQDGKARGFGGYQDPFARSAPRPKTSAKGKKKSKGRKPSLGGGSIFNLRLF